MGKLALWSAVGGIGAGMQKNIDVARKEKEDKDREEREFALHKFEAEEAAKRQQAGITSQEKISGQEIGSREKMTGQEIGSREKVAGQEIGAKKEEGAANRASAERIAGIRARATMSTHAGGKGRWNFVSQKTDPFIDPKTNQIMPGKVQNVLRDTNTGLSFVQSGDRFLLPDVDPAATKPAASSEIRKLLQNPDQADNFLATYKYLPMQFVAAQSSSANWGRNVSTTTSAPANPSADDDGSTNPDDDIPAQE